jgi:16S rRNA (cytosine1402-N4)-methyltransferase
LALDLLEPGGVLAVISFHSLEDRIVKDFLNQRAHPCTCPPDFPVCVCGEQPSLEVVTGRPLTPAEEELEANPRSSSAKLRAGRKI